MADKIDPVELGVIIQSIEKGGGTGDSTKDKNMLEIFSQLLQKIKEGQQPDEFESDQYEMLKQLLPSGSGAGTIRGRKRYLDEALEEY